MNRKREKLLKSIRTYRNLIMRQKRDYQDDLSKPLNFKFEDFIPAGGKEAKLERKKMWIHHTRISINAQMIDLKFNDINMRSDHEVETLYHEINQDEMSALR